MELGHFVFISVGVICYAPSPPLPSAPFTFLLHISIWRLFGSRTRSLPLIALLQATNFG